MKPTLLDLEEIHHNYVLVHDMTHRDSDCYDMSHQNCAAVEARLDYLVGGRHSLRCNNHRAQHYYTHLGYKFPVLVYFWSYFGQQP